MPGVVERQMLNVPDLVGQPVHIAQEIAANLGFGLAAGDPDGPGLRSRTWPGLFWVTSQDPPAGSVLERGSQIQITFVQDGQARSDVPEQTGGPTPSLPTHAEGATDS
ncbi:PASTA domain-containing protein [Pseudarthrobacter defluvii]|uniref:PASTA domain-containing protein n=1 Tax=Pseudarthrobacter defluvii TaxID=410837 RepID=UPI0027D8E483|nr:PASTA domain-containing protein [Pseudarthrobacter defluvii]